MVQQEIKQKNNGDYYMGIEKITKLLNEGKIVITPTDTIYGIMGDSTNEEVIKKIYKIKKRPLNKSLILLMDSYEMIKKYTKNIGDNEEKLIEEFMPGLVTIILEKNDKVNNLITSNTNYVGVRIPNNKELLEIINKLDKPVISTSANISEEISITNIEQLDKEIKDNVDYIYDAGEIINQSSTIVKFENDKIIIFSEGILTNKLKERFK